MKKISIFIIVSTLLINSSFVAYGQSTPTSGAPTQTVTTTVKIDQCHDGKDNDGDGRADQYGVDADKDGVYEVEPDPSCFADTAEYETGDDVVSSIIPCTDKCSFRDVFVLLNNIISFFFKQLLIPIFVIIIIFAGVKYITAEGNPSKIANLRKILWNIFKGLLLILCAWLIVRTIMNTLLSDDFKQGGIEFLGD